MANYNQYKDYLFNIIEIFVNSNNDMYGIIACTDVLYFTEKNTELYNLDNNFIRNVFEFCIIMDEIMGYSRSINNDELREVDQKILLKLKNILLYYIKNLVIETGLEIKSFEQLNPEAIIAAGQPWEIYELLMSAAEYCDYETCEKYCKIFADSEDDLVFGAILDVYKITSILNSKYDQDFADRLIAKGKLYSDDYIKSRAIILEEQINFWLKGGCQKVIDEALIEYKKNL